MTLALRCKLDAAAQNIIACHLPANIRSQSDLKSNNREAAWFRREAGTQNYCKWALAIVARISKANGQAMHTAVLASASGGRRAALPTKEALHGKHYLLPLSLPT